MNKKYNILLVDDQEENLDLYKNIFRKQYNIFLASNGNSALNIIQNEEIHLILSDQRMPDIAGVDLLSNVKNLYPDIRRIILTAYSDFEATIDAINKGSVHRYIIKPCDTDELKQIIAQELKFYALEKENKLLQAKLEEQNKLLRKWNEDLEKEVNKKTEELKQVYEQLLHSSKLALLGNLASNMAHELKNQLLGVKLLFDTIESKITHNKDITSLLNIVKEQYQITLDILEEFWNLSKKEPINYEKEMYDINKLITETLEIIKFDSTCNKHKIIYNKLNKEIFILINKNKIKQVILNLIKNAAQSMEQQGEIVIKTNIKDKFLSVSVIDTGKGIDEELKDKIWDPFFTTHNGLGLGLDICKTIIKAHNGEIYYTPNKPQGSTFTFLLPL